MDCSRNFILTGYLKRNSKSTLKITILRIGSNKFYNEVYFTVPDMGSSPFKRA